MTPKIKILHLEDLQSDSELISLQLNKANIDFENLVVDTKTEFVSALEEFTPDIVLADHSITSFNSMEALKLVKETKRDIPFLLVTTAASQEFINNIVREGAKGYILKENLDKLPAAINDALKRDHYTIADGSVTETIFLEEKLFDLKMLEDMQDNDYLAEILSIFLDETPRDIKEMQKAASSKKASVVASKAHKLKSSSGLLEANKLPRMLQEIEDTAKAGSCSPELLKLVDAASSEYLKIEKSLKNYLKNIPR